MNAPGSADPAPATPSVRRRLLCMLYEGVLLFGVVMLAGLAYGLVTQQRHALHGSNGLKLFLFAVLGAYFVYFWRRSGQTLAMLTWRIRLVSANGRPLGMARAWLRYGLAWLWFLPPLALGYFMNVRGAGMTSVVVLAWIGLYALLSKLAPDGQFVHDRLCQTRLVSAPPRTPKS